MTDRTSFVMIRMKLPYMQGAAKWCACFLDVLRVSWCYVAIAQTLTVSLRENQVWCKTSLTESFSYYHLEQN